MLIALGFVFTLSCDSTPTYSELKKKQEKAIKKLIADKGFEILKDYPVDGVFGENQYIKLDNGIYLNVVDSGNGNRAVLGKTLVLTRFIVQDFANRDEPRVEDYFDNRSYPFEFVHGNAKATMSAHDPSVLNISQDAYYYYFSTGLESALLYVGENAVVKLIIPFETGSLMQQSINIPLYYEKVRYTYYETVQ